MRNLIGSFLAFALLTSAGMASAKSGPISGPEAKGQISQRLQYSSKVADRTRPFRTQLAGNKGDRIRAFTASNMRPMIFPFAGPNGAQGGMRVNVGNIVRGTIDMKTGAVRTVSVSVPRSARPPIQ